MRKQAALAILMGLWGCGGSKTAPVGDAAGGQGGGVAESVSNTAAGDGSVIGTGGSTVVASGGDGTDAGGATETLVGGASAGNSGLGGTVSSHAGAPQTGGSVTAGSGLGGTSAEGGSVAGGRTGGTGGASITSGSATAGAVVGGSTSNGGTTETGGSKGSVVFPPRFVGNIDTRGSIATDFTTYWDQFTPENAGKWMAVQGESSEKFSWSALDTLYATCEERNIPFKEHCFVWGSAQPSWMSRLDTTTGPAVVKNWMKTFCERYPKTRLIDVVNEPPPHTTPSYINAIGGGNRTTWDWIANAFKWAREACPNAVLILNDYNNLEQDASVQNTIDIVTAIKKLDAPIDAIGCQTHGADRLPASTLKANLDKLVAATGLPVYITEYDISLSDDEQQKVQYQDHFPMFWDHPSVKGVTVWGYAIGATFRSNSWLMRDDRTMRPAMAWLMDFLKR